MNHEILCNPRVFKGNMIIIQLIAQNVPAVVLTGYDIYFLLEPSVGNELIVFDAFDGISKPWSDSYALHNKLRSDTNKIWYGKPEIQNFVSTSPSVGKTLIYPGQAFILNNDKTPKVYIATSLQHKNQYLAGPASKCFSIGEPDCLSIQDQIMTPGKVTIKLEQYNSIPKTVNSNLQDYYENLYAPYANTEALTKL